MPPTDPAPTRKQFLLALAGASPALAAAQPDAVRGQALIVVAHPDDEYAFAATIYRLARERGWAVDQVVITNGEAGYRYATLAEAVYGVPLTGESEGRQRLPAIRKQETVAAGKVLGIRRHYFPEQRDSGFDAQASQAESGNWDRARILGALDELLRREEYDAVFTLLPTRQTHGHHRRTALLALEAASALPADRRPALFGAEAGLQRQPARTFAGLPGEPLTRTAEAKPVFQFDRSAVFGYRNSLTYQIVVNWVIAEHKSQGLFQSDAGRHDVERFWLFAGGGSRPAAVAQALAAATTPDSAYRIRARRPDRSSP